MAKKTTETPDGEFDRAARKLQVPRAVLKLWLADQRGFSPAEWSHWKSGRRKIPPEAIDEFLEWRTGRDIAWEDGEWIKRYLDWLTREKIASE